MGRYSIKKRKYTIMDAKRGLKKWNENRWLERARGMSRMKLLYLIVRIQHIFDNEHPQMIIYKQVAGVSHIDKLAKGDMYEISEKMAEDNRLDLFWREYASIKNRLY